MKLKKRIEILEEDLKILEDNTYTIDEVNELIDDVVSHETLLKIQRQVNELESKIKSLTMLISLIMVDVLRGNLDCKNAKNTLKTKKIEKRGK